MESNNCSCTKIRMIGFFQWWNNENVFVPIYLGIVGIAGLIIFVSSYLK